MKKENKNGALSASHTRLHYCRAWAPLLLRENTKFDERNIHRLGSSKRWGDRIKPHLSHSSLTRSRHNSPCHSVVQPLHMKSWLESSPQSGIRREEALPTDFEEEMKKEDRNWALTFVSNACARLLLREDTRTSIAMAREMRDDGQCRNFPPGRWGQFSSPWQDGRWKMDVFRNIIQNILTRTALYADMADQPMNVG